MAYIPFVYTEDVTSQHDTREAQYAGNLMLLELRRAVEASIPGCRTTLYSNRRAWVYMPEDPVAMGEIGYGLFSRKGSASTYMVYSRTVTNKKYSDRNEQHHMILSKSLKNTVTSAKTYLRSVPIQEVALSDATFARHASGTAQNAVRATLSVQQRALFGVSYMQLTPPSPVLEALLRIIETNPDALDPSLVTDIQTYMDTVAEHSSLSQGYNADFVAITQDSLGQRVTVVPVDNMHAYTPKAYEPQVFYGSDVPEHIAGKVAVLSMVAPDTYVPGVGYRHKAGMFYVSR